jgi:uncharacterized protein with HEPN domain
MTRRDETLYLVHMRESAAEAIKLVGDRTKQEFLADAALKYAVVYLIQRIGEAARRVSRDRQETIPLPWSDIIGMRNKVVHDYLEIDFELVWKTVDERLP